MASWTLTDSSVALTPGSFWVAAAGQEPDGVTLLGYNQQGPIYEPQSSLIPAGPSPGAIAAVTEPGGAWKSDLAILNEGAGTITLLRQLPGSSPAPNGFPAFSASAIPVTGSPSSLLGEPFGARLDFAAAIEASPTPTDLALLEPSGAASVMLARAPRLSFGPAMTDFPRVATGSVSSRPDLCRRDRICVDSLVDRYQRRLDSWADRSLLDGRAAARIPAAILGRA